MDAELDLAWERIANTAPNIITAGAPKGWGRVIAWMLEGFDLASPPGVRANGQPFRPEVETLRICSIESDAGRLVIDTDGPHAISDQTHAVYQAVQALAAATCERCGMAGIHRSDYDEVACDPHYRELRGLLDG